MGKHRDAALRELECGIDDMNFEDDYCRVVKVYAKRKRTAEEERADVVAWLRLHSSEPYRVIAECIEGKGHVGAAKKGPV